MLKSTSSNFKKYFLLQFTKELIQATETYKSLVIKKQVKEVVHRKPLPPPRAQMPVRKRVHQIVRARTHRDRERISQMQGEPFANFFKPESMRAGPPVVLKIPELALPQTVKSITPTTRRENIDLGKLNPLVNDPLVKTIECSGPEEKVVVTGRMGRKNTSITLTKEDIDSIVSKFSEATKIPAQEGFFKVAFGNLLFSAIISKIISSKFIITKMN